MASSSSSAGSYIIPDVTNQPVPGGYENSDDLNDPITEHPLLLDNERILNAINNENVNPEESSKLARSLSPVLPEEQEKYAEIILRCSQAVDGTEVFKVRRKRSKLSQSVGVSKNAAYLHGVRSPVVAKGSKKKAKECIAVSLDTGLAQKALRLKESNVTPDDDKECAIHEKFSSHSNVVTLLDKRTYQSGFKRKREIYVEKADSTMAQAISNPAFDLTAKAHAMRGIATAVAHMHSENMCHNDLNLGNLFIKDGIGKISDFGISDQPGKRLPTVFGPIKAPEQPVVIDPITNKKKLQASGSFESDVYQFGLALWHVFHPDPNHLHLELDDRALPPDIRYAVPDQENRFIGWPCNTVQEDMVIKLIQDCTQNDPAKRPSMQQVKNRLAQIEEINGLFNGFDGR